MKKSLFSIFAVILIGCSNKQIYNAIQENQRMECSKLPQRQYEECMREHETSYEDYERAREEIQVREAVE